LKLDYHIFKSAVNAFLGLFIERETSRRRLMWESCVVA
jgi:hypothetical protein